MTHERREYSATAAGTTITAGIDADDVAMTIDDPTGWPDGTVGPFFAVLGRGTSNEEKILVTERTGVTLTGVTRGADGTAAAPHSSGTSIEHCFTKTDADESNSHYADDAYDHHGQYLNTARHDVPARHPAAALPMGVLADVAPSAVGNAAAAGVSGKVADASHVHAREGFGSPAAVHQTTAADGGNPTVPHSDHVHAQPDATPRGVLGFAKAEAPQAAIVAEVDLAGLSVAVAVPAGRRIKISAQATMSSTVGGDRFSVLVREGGVQHQNIGPKILTAGGAAETISGFVVLAPTAGAHTYRLTALRNGGTGTGTMAASATVPACILVEDIGAA